MISISPEFFFQNQKKGLVIQNCISNCREKDGPRQLEKYLKEVLPSSKGERDVLIEIFAAIGILEPKKERPTRGGTLILDILKIGVVRMDTI